MEAETFSKQRMKKSKKRQGKAFKKENILNRSAATSSTAIVMWWWCLTEVYKHGVISRVQSDYTRALNEMKKGKGVEEPNCCTNKHQRLHQVLYNFFLSSVVFFLFVYFTIGITAALQYDRRYLIKASRQV